MRTGGPFGLLLGLKHNLEFGQEILRVNAVQHLNDCRGAAD